eukprot:5548783-Alexandrium_andersonii.AAC.1
MPEHVDVAIGRQHGEYKGEVDTSVQDKSNDAYRTRRAAATSDDEQRLIVIAMQWRRRSLAEVSAQPLGGHIPERPSPTRVVLALSGARLES